MRKPLRFRRVDSFTIRVEEKRAKKTFRDRRGDQSACFSEKRNCKRFLQKLRRKIITGSPSPVSLRNKLKIIKTGKTPAIKKNQEIFKKGFRSPPPNKFQKFHLSSTERKKQMKYMNNRKGRRNPLEFLMKKINALSPNISRNFAQGKNQTTDRNRKVKKSKKKEETKEEKKEETKEEKKEPTVFNGEFIPLGENMKETFERCYYMFDDLHCKIRDLKKDQGLCKSPFVLSKKLEKIKFSKERLRQHENTLTDVNKAAILRNPCLSERNNLSY
ncbi:unnamed protein product [Moneuplotes crassus]|uniref:Uncharacterized protein n=1 Tax=Euplotes crassus TaxID=5936 RepID=A0AAD1U2P9_EUPCR|nr:unnamed protein product [Moneuplotes crassus]